MRAVVQRVRLAQVAVAGERVGEMGEGLLALVGVGRRDRSGDAEALAERLVQLRVLPDAEGRMNRCLLDSGGSLGVVSQFTLYGDVRRGRRPSYAAAAAPEAAEPLLDVVVETARRAGVSVMTGRFGAEMEVSLINAGPVTILLDSEKVF